MVRAGVDERIRRSLSLLGLEASGYHLSWTIGEMCRWWCRKKRIAYEVLREYGLESCVGGDTKTGTEFTSQVPLYSGFFQYWGALIFLKFTFMSNFSHFINNFFHRFNQREIKKRRRGSSCPSPLILYLLNKNKSRCKEKEPDGQWGVGTDKILTAPVRADHVRTQSTCIRI